MGYRGCGGHQAVSFQHAREDVRRIDEEERRKALPVLRVLMMLGVGNYAKLMGRDGCLCMVSFEPGKDGEDGAARRIAEAPLLTLKDIAAQQRRVGRPKKVAPACPAALLEDRGEAEAAE